MLLGAHSCSAKEPITAVAKRWFELEVQDSLANEGGSTARRIHAESARNLPPFRKDPFPESAELTFAEDEVHALSSCRQPTLVSLLRGLLPRKHIDERTAQVDRVPPIRILDFSKVVV